MQIEQASRVMDDAALAAEAALVARACRDPEAFAALYDRYVGGIYGYALRRLSSHAEAEDVTAQTFQHAIERLPQYQARGAPFGAWLFRIAANLIVDRYRSGRRAVSLDQLREDGFQPGDPDLLPPEARLIDLQEADAAWAAVARLPALQRRAVTLRFGRELSHAEVGAIIGRSEAATKQIIYRAMKTVRQQMGVK